MLVSSLASEPLTVKTIKVYEFPTVHCLDLFPRITKFIFIIKGNGIGPRWNGMTRPHKTSCLVQSEVFFCVWGGTYAPVRSLLQVP
jgi:hypothetical protein